MAAADEEPDVVVVDGANVVGSRPDGWWNDRAGAAARLHAALVAGDWPAGRLVLVLEGRARAGVPVGTLGGVEVVHAAGEGDDTIVDRARELVGSGDRVAVVSADRGLITRIEQAGATSLRPRWILDRLDPPDRPGRREPRPRGPRASGYEAGHE